MTNKIPDTVDQAELARILNLTQRQVRNLTGVVLRSVGKDGLRIIYAVPEAIHAFIHYREQLVLGRCRKARMSKAFNDRDTLKP